MHVTLRIGNDALCGMSPWRPFLGLSSLCPPISSARAENHRNNTENQSNLAIWEIYYLNFNELFHEILRCIARSRMARYTIAIKLCYFLQRCIGWTMQCTTWANLTHFNFTYLRQRPIVWPSVSAVQLYFLPTRWTDILFIYKKPGCSCREAYSDIQ